MKIKWMILFILVTIFLLCANTVIAKTEFYNNGIDAAIIDCQKDSIAGQGMALIREEYVSSLYNIEIKQWISLTVAQIDTPSSDIIIYQGDSVNFASSNNGGQRPYIYWWDFGGIGGSALEDPGNITFDTAGIYTIVFYVQDSHGSVVSDSVTVTVNAKGDHIPTSVQIDIPSFDFTISQYDSVNFRGTVIGTLTPFLFWWDFGGIGGSALEDPGHITFNSAGTYTIILYAQDSHGTVVSDSVTVTVNAIGVPIPLSSHIDIPSTDINQGDSINFTGTVYGSASFYIFWWDFGGIGGSVLEDPGYITFDTAGTYNITFWVMDSGGDITSDSIIINVIPEYSTPDMSVPEISITSPTTDTSFGTDSDSVAIGGTASDDVGITLISWSNLTGGSGKATGTTNWSIAAIPLVEGENVITITASDSVGNLSFDTLTVIYTALISNPAGMLQDFEDGILWTAGGNQDPTGNKRGWAIRYPATGDKAEIDTIGSNGSDKSLKITFSSSNNAEIYFRSDDKTTDRMPEAQGANRMSFYVRFPKGFPIQPKPFRYCTWQLGTYIHDSDDWFDTHPASSESDHGIHHYYHRLTIERAGEGWVKYIINTHPDQANYSGKTVPPDMPYYYNNFGRFYFHFGTEAGGPEPSRPFSIWIDEIKFYYDDGSIGGQVHDGGKDDPGFDGEFIKD